MNFRPSSDGFLLCFLEVINRAFCSSLLESIRKVLDKQAVKFVRAIKQETRSGKSEDRILVRSFPDVPCDCHATSVGAGDFEVLRRKRFWLVRP